MSSLLRFTLDLVTLAVAAARTTNRRPSAQEYHPNRRIDATGISRFHFSVFFFCAAPLSLLAWTFDSVTPRAFAQIETSDAPNLRVRARSVLAVEVNPAERRLEARLTDEFGRAIADRTLYLEDPRSLLQMEKSDRLGRASFDLPKRPPKGELRIRFKGDAHYDEAERLIDRLEPRVVTTLIPSLDRKRPRFIDGFEGEDRFIPLRVHARSTQGGEGLWITLKDEDGAILGRAETDALGRALISFRPSPRMRPGENRITLETDGDEKRSPSHLSLVLTLDERTEVELRPFEADRGEPLMLEGVIRGTWSGPIDRAPIELSIEGRNVERTHSGPDGAFRFVIPAFDAPGVYRAALHYRGDEAKGLGPLSLTDIAIEIPRLGSAARRSILVLIPIVLVLLGFFARSRLYSSLERRGEEGRRENNPRGLEVEDRGTQTSLRARLSPRRRFGLNAPRFRLIEASGGGPIEGGTIRSEGTFLAQTDARGLTPKLPIPERGHHRLEIECEGFLGTTIELELPHRGADLLEIALERTRQAPSRALIRLARSRGHREEALQALSHREIAQAIAREGEDLNALIEAIDRLYYGEDAPDTKEAIQLRARIEALEHRSGSVT